METNKTIIAKTPENISVYWEDNNLKGCAEANPAPSFLPDNYWWISRVVINPEIARGNGIGTRILLRLIKEIKSVGGVALVVIPGGYNNNKTKQENFYKKNGFTWKTIRTINETTRAMVYKNK